MEFAILAFIILAIIGVFGMGNDPYYEICPYCGGKAHYDEMGYLICSYCGRHIF